MEQLEKDLRLASALIEYRIPYIRKYQFERVYPFANENISGCLPLFDLEGKDCLVTLGSSDQALDLVLHGANSLTGFDINPLTKHYFYLKKAALEAGFTKQEYLDFFCFKNYEAEYQDNSAPFHYEFYRSLAPYLEGESKEFWHILFKNYKPLEIRRSTGIFMDDEMPAPVLEETVGYLEDDKYEQLQEKISGVQLTFINTDIKALPLRLKKPYDFMYFSNIIQYVDKMYSAPEILESSCEIQCYQLNKYKNLLEKTSSFLREDGQMVAGYIYTLDEPLESIAIFNPKVREKVFMDDHYSYLRFRSLNSVEWEKKRNLSIEKEDACLVYQKKRKVSNSIAR